MLELILTQRTMVCARVVLIEMEYTSVILRWWDPILEPSEQGKLRFSTLGKYGLILGCLLMKQTVF